MSSVVHPVGPEDPKVYWVRRLVVVLIAIVAVVLLAALINSMFSGGDEDTPPAAGETTDPADPESPGEEPPAVVACTPEQLAVSVATTERAFPAGTPVTFVLQLANTSTLPCTVDASEAAREILVTSGSDRIWSSLDCPAEGAVENVVELPADGMVSETRYEWTRIRSDESCTADLPEPRPGTYKAVVTVGGVTSEQATFDLG